MQHGFQSIFATISLTEHDYLKLLKMSVILHKGLCNNIKQQLAAEDEEDKETEKVVGIVSLLKQDILFSDREFEQKMLPEILE